MSEENPEPKINLSNVDWSQAIVCYTHCWSCNFGCHFDPPRPHTWMDEEDAAYAGQPWPLSPEVAAAQPCACRCAKPKESTP